MPNFASLLIGNKIFKDFSMDWINDLLWGEGIGHSILLLSFVIAAGIQLGKIKVFGISLGITLVLFVGIILGHFGFTVNHNVIHFFKEFGLILFVYSVGMQVGPGFFSSFRQGGITLNMLACGIVFLGVATALVLHFVTGIPMPTMVGILSGAVTNTPGLGAAQQAYSDMYGVSDNTIALGYAVAYPLGVIGIILSIIFVRYVFRVNFDKENDDLNKEDASHTNEAKPISLVVKNPAVFGKTVGELSGLMDHLDFVISRVWRNDNKQIEIASAGTILNEDDKIFVITTDQDAESVKTFIGEEIDMERKQWIRMESQFINRRILITKPELNGKKLGQLKLRKLYGINITRINRAGVDLVATPGLTLQVGDRVNVVGTETAVSNVEKVLGNSLKRLNEPNLITIFIGIALGIVLGSIPITFPGIPQPVKLGLAGGPLIVAILISRFGYRYKLVTYTTQSANLMLREIGITLFLACVGISAGDGFVDTIVNNGGFAWIGYGFIITTIPLLIIGCVGRYFYKINYFTLMGLIAGSTTDPPALAYSNATAGNDAPSVGYATVYPLTMFSLGIVLGSIPITFPGIPQPVKLGLAGGPLIVAILISRFGYRYKLVTYTTQSANLMLREIGITLFLACVGISAGDGFVDTIVNNGGFAWIGYGFIITTIPLLIIGCVGRYFYKINYFTLMGLIAGSTTDPPALAYSNATAGNDAPSVGYATVYPLTMFLRVLTAQLLILFFA